MKLPRILLRTCRRACLLLLPATAAAAGALSTAGCQFFESKDPGERIYRRYCSDCHGVDGRGNTPLYMGNAWADLTDNRWKTYGDEGTLETIIREGVFGEMPGRTDLSRDEMRALLGHLRKLRGETAE